MTYNDHSKLAGSHAFLGASTYHWLNYSEDKLADTYRNNIAKLRGTELHEFAEQCIRLRQKLPRSKKSLNMYVNDAIGYRMDPEVILYYSDNCFGTADSIIFKDGLLRIHDLKTGLVPAHMEQLFIYDALFCLEYKIKPGEIYFENRIYQNDEIVGAKPTAENILPIMDKIIRFDEIIEKIKKQEG